MSFILPKQDAFGLDISDYILRLVNIENNQIVSVAEIDLPVGLFSKGEIIDAPGISQYIKKLLEKIKGKKIKKKYVIACLPEQKTFVKVIDLPDNKPIVFEELLADEITKHIPYNLEEIYLDWQYLPGGEKNKILIGVVPKKVVNDFQKIIMDADLIPLTLEVEAIAISRCLVNQSANDNFAQILLDIGFNRTSLMVYDRQTVQFSISIPLSGDALTKTIANDLSFTYQQAEKAKVVCGFDEKKCDRALFKILKPAVSMLINNLNGAISFYQNHFTGQQPIKKILLCGGGANFKNLDQILRTETGMVVEKGNVLTNLKAAPSNNLLPKNKYLPYVTVIGLALSNAYKNK